MRSWVVAIKSMALLVDGRAGLGVSQALTLAVPFPRVSDIIVV